MTATIAYLDEKADMQLRDLCEGMFLKGKCYAFAIALHQGLGWPIVGLIDSDNAVCHALVRKSKKGMFYDARGPITKGKIGRPFGLTAPYKLRPIDEQDLHKIRRIGERSIARARQMAEVLWPKLPWKDSLQERVRSFAEELEELSHKHSMWIRAVISDQPPILTPSFGGETGYTLQLTDSGTTFTIDRALS